jgi:hypothetical protein
LQGAQPSLVGRVLRHAKGRLSESGQTRAVKQTVNVPVFANENMLYYSDLAHSFTTIVSAANTSAEGQLYVHHDTNLTLGLTRYKSHTVLSTRTEQPYHAPDAPPTSFLPRPPPLSSSQRHSLTLGLHEPRARLSLHRSRITDARGMVARQGRRVPAVIARDLDAHGPTRPARPARPIAEGPLDEQVKVVNEFKARLDVRFLSRPTEARALMR